jgi:mannosyl-3-phosphoglycerate phosphatase
MKTLIFTDLDGTFLNHDDYSYEASKEALKAIQDKDIPLIFTTSKTKTEVIKLHQQIGIQEPFIIENGAALFIPKNYQNLDLSTLDELDGYKMIKLGKTYQQILNFYNTYKDEFGMHGFSDMTIDEVAAQTGLNIESAQLSKQRDFTEPFLLKDPSKLENLNNLALTYHIKITQGGRFFHLIGEKQDKGIAVQKTINLFATLYNDTIRSLALGDGPNDIVMLQNVDIPIVIKNHQGQYLHNSMPHAQYSSFEGSRGFNEMVLKNVN